MEYILGEDFLKGRRKDISAEEYLKLKKSNEVVRAIWDIEEIFLLFADSYLELEQYLLSSCIQYCYGRGSRVGEDVFWDEARQSLNLKLVSVVTSSSAYVEQAKRRTSQLSKLTDCLINTKTHFEEAFDSSLEYRVMSALRNHVLHANAPVARMNFSWALQTESGTLPSDEPCRVRYTSNPTISVEDFIGSDKIRAATRDEVRGLGQKSLDLKFLVRAFVSKLANCHQCFGKTPKRS